MLLATPLAAATQKALEDIVAQSFIEQTRLEQSDTEDFSAYVARYEAALALTSRRLPVNRAS